MQKIYAMLDQDKRTRREVWSRVMGYFRPVESWNIGKKSEYKDRLPYKEKSLQEKEMMKVG